MSKVSTYNSINTIQDLITLYREVENNLKLLEYVNGELVFPIGSELRYVCAHVMNILVVGNKNHDVDKALGHLNRAYRDSINILLDSISMRYRRDVTLFLKNAHIARSLGIDVHRYSEIVKEMLLLRQSIADEVSPLEIGDKINKLKHDYLEICNRLDISTSAFENFNKEYWKRRLIRLLMMIATFTSVIVTFAIFIMNVFGR